MIKKIKKEVFLLSCVIFVVSFSSFSVSATNIFTTDILGNIKNDFSPEEIVFIRGYGFNSFAFVFIDIKRPDFVTENFVTITNSYGDFIYWYDLNGIKGDYHVFASDGINNAETFFSDSAIWTTRNDCGSQSQNVNLFSIGEIVYINGNGFSAGNYSWEIKGKPGGASCDPNQVVANGTQVVNASGTFCIGAYNVSSGDCEEYQAKFDTKGDNYRVTGGNCTKNKDCGEENSELACFGNNVTNITFTPACLNGSCVFTNSTQFIMSCGNASSQVVCIGNNLTNVSIMPGCSGGSCINTTTYNIIRTCQGGCENSTCLPFCSDGIKEGNEECDDGNTQNGDGCSSSCKIECHDADNDEICDNDDNCPDSKPNEEVDEDGCDAFQFCEKFYCGINCFFADFENDEQNVTSPKDCTVVILLKEGEHYTKCVPLSCE